MDTLTLVLIGLGFGIFLYFYLKFKFFRKKKKKKGGFGVMSETLKGETVRSKAEKVVADYLYENEIEYIYENTIELGKNREHKIKYDFWLPDLDIYIEYWGLENAKGDVGEKYKERKDEKLELYDRYNLKLISIDESHLKTLDKYLPAEIKRLSKKKVKLGGFSDTLKKFLFGIEVDRSVYNPDAVEQLFCVKCGAEIADGEFCVNCGSAEDDAVIKVHCTGCGTENEKKPDEKVFCSNCGTEVV